MLTVLLLEMDEGAVLEARAVRLARRVGEPEPEESVGDPDPDPDPGPPESRFSLSDLVDVDPCRRLGRRSRALSRPWSRSLKARAGFLSRVELALALAPACEVFP